MKKSKNNRIFELRFSNLLLASGIVVCTALSIVSSILLGNFFDFLAARLTFDRDTFLYIVIILCALLLSIISNAVLAQFLPLRLELKKSVTYSQEVMSDLLKISQKSYQSKEKGYYINLVTSSAFTCGDIYGQLNVELVGSIMCVFLMLAVAACINPYFGLIYLVYIPIFALLTQKPNKKIAEFQKAGLPTQDAFLSGTKKIVEDKRTINVARAEEYFEKIYKERSQKYLSFVTKFKWYSILSTNMPTVLSVILTAVTLGISAKLYLDKRVTIGTILVIFQLSQLLQEPLKRCFEILTYRSINEAHVERISKFRELKNESTGFERVYQEQDSLANIHAGKLFSTSAKERMLFSTEELVLPKNKLIVIKGGNGTGKSTFVNLLTGFADIDIFDSRIELDETLSRTAYLSHPLLFTNGDLNENMFGKEINPIVLDMLGITFQDKKINESGNNLSFGEQQKVGLLRVLSSNSKVLVLDEPFTNLDQVSIERLTTYIAELKKEKTVIVIMHSHELDEFADIMLNISNEKLECIDAKSI